MGVHPETMIVAALLGVIALMGVVTWHQRRSARARIDALRGAARMEIALVSPARASLIAGIATVALLLGFFVLVLALGDGSRAHAVWIVPALLVLTPVCVLSPLYVAKEWQRAGTITLDDHALVLELAGTRAAIDLDDEWGMDELVVMSGRRTEVMLVMHQAGAALAVRYPVFLGDDVLAPEGRFAAPQGVLLPHEARAMHERLRAALARRA